MARQRDEQSTVVGIRGSRIPALHKVPVGVTQTVAVASERGLRLNDVSWLEAAAVAQPALETNVLQGIVQVLLCNSGN